MQSLYFYYHLEIIMISHDNQPFKEELKTILIIYYQMILQEATNDVYNQCNQQTKNQHGDNWEIKPRIIFFNPDITGQSSDPVKFIVKEIDQDTDQNSDYPQNNDVFTGVLIHGTRLQVSRCTLHEVTSTNETQN